MDDPCKITNIENSPLFKKIAEAIKDYGLNANGVWINITKEAEDYTPENEDNTYTLKWLSWSLVDSKNNELFEPHLVPVHPGITEKQIETDLSTQFPRHKIIVDNEIMYDYALNTGKGAGSA